MVIALMCCQVLFGCAAKHSAPMVSVPTVVQVPDPAVIHKVWEAGYAAGYGAAHRLETRRSEQQQDELANLPVAVSTPAVAPPASPIADAPFSGGFQSLGPATPIRTGN
jgi:hypothetical protein